MVDTVTLALEGLLVEVLITMGDLPAFQNESIELLISADSTILKSEAKKRQSNTEE